MDTSDQHPLALAEAPERAPQASRRVRWAVAVAVAVATVAGLVALLDSADDVRRTRTVTETADVGPFAMASAGDEPVADLRVDARRIPAVEVFAAQGTVPSDVLTRGSKLGWAGELALLGDGRHAIFTAPGLIALRDLVDDTELWQRHLELESDRVEVHGETLAESVLYTVNGGALVARSAADGIARSTVALPPEVAGSELVTISPEHGIAVFFDPISRTVGALDMATATVRYAFESQGDAVLAASVVGTSAAPRMILVIGRTLTVHALGGEPKLELVQTHFQWRAADVAPDASAVWIGRGDAAVDRFDLTTGVVRTWRIDGGGSIFDVAALVDDVVVVDTELAGAIALSDATGEAVARVPGDGRAIARSQSGGHLVVSPLWAAPVVYDAALRPLSTTPRLVDEPSAVAVGPSRFATLGSDGGVLAFSSVDGAFLGSRRDGRLEGVDVDLGPGVGPLARALVVADERGIDLLADDASSTRRLEVQGIPSAVRISPDGQRLLVTTTDGYDPGGTFVLDVVDGQVAAPRRIAEAELRLATWSADGSLVLGIDGGDAVMVDVAAGVEVERERLVGDGYPAGLAVARTGTALVATVDESVRVRAVGDASAVDRFEAPGMGPVVFDPRGERVAFLDPRGELVVATLGSAKQVRLPAGDGMYDDVDLVVDMAFTADGDGLLVCRESGSCEHARLE